MSGQKRPADPSCSSGAPPEKRREREEEDAGSGVSATAGGSTAVETVIKLGGVSNSVRPLYFLVHHENVMFFCLFDCLNLYHLFFQEEQDIKALQAKNRKLGEALDQRQVI